ALSAPPAAIALADTDGDGDLDVAAAEPGRIELLVGDGKGGLSVDADSPYSLTMFGNPLNPRALAVGQLNGDRAPDLVVSEAMGMAIAYAGVLLNERGTLTGLATSPNPALFGQTVTLTAKVAPSVASVAVLPSGSVSFYDQTALLGSAM